MVTFRSLVKGGFYSDDPSNRSVPRSIRCNNAGAINSPAWVRSQPGFVEAQLDAVGNDTAVFETPEHGVATWWELLRRYRASAGRTPFNLRYILTRYSGGNARTAAEYAAFVSNKAGISPLAAIDIENSAGLLPIARAFFHYEAGQPSPLKDEQILYGFALARSGEHTPAVAAFTDSLGTSGGRRARLVTIAKAEAARTLRWTAPTDEAEKYLAPLRPIMRQLGHIGTRPVLYDWCAAFVTWCTRQAGYQIPDQPIGFWASMALVESWRHWGAQQGLLKETSAGFRYEPGDILLFEWFDGDRTLDHIGVCVGPASGGKVPSAEGNAGNKTDLVSRAPANIPFVLRLPD